MLAFDRAHIVCSSGLALLVRAARDTAGHFAVRTSHCFARISVIDAAANLVHQCLGLGVAVTGSEMHGLAEGIGHSAVP